LPSSGRSQEYKKKEINTLAILVGDLGPYDVLYKVHNAHARDARRITAADEIHEKNSRIHLDRLQHKYTNCKLIKNNTNIGQITGIREKLDTTCK
jgi:hypothetical protein